MEFVELSGYFVRESIWAVENFQPAAVGSVDIGSGVQFQKMLNMPYNSYCSINDRSH